MIGSRRSRGRLRQSWREALWFYIMVLPWIIGFILFMGGPIIASFYLSFTEYDMMTNPVFVGFDNYTRLFAEDPLFWKILGNTSYYTLLAVPTAALFAIGLAALLNKPLRGMRIYRTLAYIPVLVPIVAAVMVFRWVLAPDVGLINQALKAVGITGPYWLNDQNWVIPALALLALWHVGSSVVLLLAGMQGIPKELLEASLIDGANPRQQFFRITLPMLSPIILFNVVMGLIGSFQVFVQPYILTKGGPDNASQMIVPYIYEEGFKNFRMGYASALSWVLFVIIMVGTGLIFRFSGRWVFYESEVRR